jgi:hypothetical protein
VWAEALSAPQAHELPHKSVTSPGTRLSKVEGPKTRPLAAFFSDAVGDHLCDGDAAEQDAAPRHPVLVLALPLARAVLAVLAVAAYRSLNAGPVTSPWLRPGLEASVSQSGNPGLNDSKPSVHH